MSNSVITRREFLLKTGAAAVVATAGVPLRAEPSARPSTRVVLIRHQAVVDDSGKADGAILERMFDEATVALFDTENAGQAWKRLVKPADTVGIKTNVWRYLRTPADLENAIRARIVAAGVPAERIGVDDRGVLSNPLFTGATALVNVRPMRAHNWSGVGGCLKNYIMFTQSPPDYHPDSCVDLGALWNLPAVKGKTRLNILVMLTPQFNCLGPHHFDRDSIWPYRGLLVGTDPVAVDAVGLKIIEAKRLAHFKEPSPMRPPAKHIRAAEEKHGVGVADMSRIELVRLGWKDDALI